MPQTKLTVNSNKPICFRGHDEIVLRQAGNFKLSQLNTPAQSVVIDGSQVILSIKVRAAERHIALACTGHLCQ